ncbi:crotonase/enoyl-CoA hydratase family protein [Pararhizobium haloflavum]|uniref:crotonase/enoyl-CoA hydratase family protein n=1 Tax=Pararhizobium haloflavum TaxID=2037914 RepID=UPI000C1A0834|nr:crotonase/enoyl-CoA hydratase family protein [Pararhizobium haloflavum]
MSPSDIVQTEIVGEIAVLRFNRPDKRNAVNDALIDFLGGWFAAPPKGVKVAVIAANGDHFSAGLDLSEHVERDAFGVLKHSRRWHDALEKVQYGGLPVVAALKGGVIGGGLEIAAAAHVRIAEPSAFFQLPEGRRGIFVGGGATVRVARIVGADRMTEMMLTGRRYSAQEGLRLGLAHYAVGEGEAEAKAMELAREIAGNAALSNYMMIQAVSRISDMAPAEGLFAESMAAALAQTSGDAKAGLSAFLAKQKPRFD